MIVFDGSAFAGCFMDFAGVRLLLLLLLLLFFLSLHVVGGCRRPSFCFSSVGDVYIAVVVQDAGQMPICL